MKSGKKRNIEKNLVYWVYTQGRKGIKWINKIRTTNDDNSCPEEV